MKSNPIAVATNAKGLNALYHRSLSIARRYGLTSTQMDRALGRFSDLLGQLDCKATFPITAVALKRHRKSIQKYLDQHIEFAVHGYTHVDYAQLPPMSQIEHLRNARKVFVQAGITPMGFRSPYLSREPGLNEAINTAGFCYVSNQPIVWDVLEKQAFPASTYAGYERALAFYDPWRASKRLSLPTRLAQLVEIPVSLPDDEILIERMGGETGLVEETWLNILSQSHKRGELFTLQLHPERIALCADALSAVVTKARTLTPAVWCACLSQIAAWWKVRARTRIEIVDTEDGLIHLGISGPPELTVLIRGVQTDAPCLPWSQGFNHVKALAFAVRSPIRPFVGLSPAVSPALKSFLNEQGFITEISPDRHCYAYYFDQPDFSPESELQVLAQMDGTDIPLVRLGRWPNGAQSALAITGDIDALTLWDYGLRLLGN